MGRLGVGPGDRPGDVRGSRRLHAPDLLACRRVPRQPAASGLGDRAPARRAGPRAQAGRSGARGCAATRDPGRIAALGGSPQTRRSRSLFLKERNQSVQERLRSRRPKMSHALATDVVASRRIRRVQRTALALLVLSGVVNYIDRATLAIANPLIRQDLGLSIADMGLLLSAFLWAYAFSQLPGGALLDRLGPRRMLGAGLVLWSVAQAAAGFVAGFWQFVITRALLGLGEAPMFSG